MVSLDMPILIVGENSQRLALIKEGLLDAGHENLICTQTMTGLAGAIERAQPYVVIIDLEHPSWVQQEGILQLCQAFLKPMIVFVDASDEAETKAAIDAGVSAYIIDGLKKERIKPVLDMAINRFNAHTHLLSELRETKAELEGRKIIERAKGLLMESKQLSEQDAYRLMRKTAMKQSRKLKDVAESLVMAADILK